MSTVLFLANKQTRFGAIFTKILITNTYYLLFFFNQFSHINIFVLLINAFFPNIGDTIWIQNQEITYNHRKKNNGKSRKGGKEFLI